MPFNVEAARKAGYSDADIAGYLSSQNPSFDAAAARKAGYGDTDIITALATRDGAKPSYDERYAAEAKAGNEAASPWANFRKSVGLGAAKRMLGVGELGLNIAQALGADVKDMKETIAMGQQEADIQGTGTGKAGFVGEVMGDPTTYVVPGAGAGQNITLKALMGAGAKAGALSGVTQGTGDAQSGLTDNLKHGATGAAVGVAAAPVVASGAKVIQKGADIVTGGTNRVLAALGSDKAADRIVYSDMAQRMLASGKSPAEVEVAINEARATGLMPTVGEATGARTQMQAEKRIASGANTAGQDFNQRVTARATQDIPAQIENRGRDLATGKSEANSLYKQAANESDALQTKASAAIAQPAGTAAQTTTMQQVQSLNKPWEALKGARDAISTRLGELGGVNNIENKALTQAKTILDNAEQRGMSFEAILDAKKQLGDMFIEGADATAQKRANSFVTGFVKQLDSALNELAPGTYQKAVTAWKKGLAGKELVNAVNESGVGDVNAMYNAVWKTPEQRAEFLNKLPDDASRAEFKQFFDTLEKVRNGFGGDVAGISGGAGEGGALPLTKTGFIRNAIDKVGDMLTPSNIGERATEAAFNPDVERLSGAMVKAGKNVSANPVVKATTGTIATQPSRNSIAPPEREPMENQAPFNGGGAQQDVGEPGAKPQAADDAIGRAATQLGNDADTMRRIAMVESSGNPDAKNPKSSAGGLYQFTDGTWNDLVSRYGKEYGISAGDKMKPEANAIMANLYAKENAAALRDTVGRDPNATEIYLAHFLGLSGAKKMLASLDKPVSAAQIFPSAARANSGVFFMEGDPRRPLTPAGVYRALTQKLGEAV